MTRKLFATSNDPKETDFDNKILAVLEIATGVSMLGLGAVVFIVYFPWVAIGIASIYRMEAFKLIFFYILYLAISLLLTFFSISKFKKHKQ